MDDSMYEKLNIGPTLNFNEKLNRQSLNKKFSTHINKSMISMPLKKTVYHSYKWGYYWKISAGGEEVKKLVLFQNKRPYNLETFECNHKKLGTESETSLLNNCGKLFSLSSKKLQSSWPGSSVIFATSK